MIKTFRRPATPRHRSTGAPRDGDQKRRSTTARGEAEQATSQGHFARVTTTLPYSCVGTRPADDNKEGVLRRLGDVSVVRHLQSVIAVTGLAFEAKIAGGVAVVRDGRRTVATLNAAIERGGRGIMSFGIAGGLAPGLRPGQWVVASRVISERGCHEVDQQWSERLVGALPGTLQGAIAGVDAPACDACAKRALFVHTGALVVDMESHLAARIAAAHGLPFVACRVILDPADRNLPPAALLSLRPNGIPDLAAVLRSIVEQPNQLPGLMRLALDAAIARTALRRGRAALGPGLAFPDLTA
jgi:hopanoid-associated phosphorylase